MKLFPFPSRKKEKREAEGTMKDQTKHLYRSRSNKTLAGVCGGIAEYFGFDPTIVRLLWVVLTLFGGSGILLYVIAYFVMPKNPDYSVPPPHSAKADFTAGKVVGIFLMFIGVLLLLDNLDIFSFHSFWHESWEFVLPAIFVFAGIALILKAERKEGPKIDPSPGKPAGSMDQPSAVSGEANQESRNRIEKILHKHRSSGNCGDPAFRKKYSVYAEDWGNISILIPQLCVLSMFFLQSFLPGPGLFCMY
jgi:phage shock protein C